MRPLYWRASGTRCRFDSFTINGEQCPRPQRTQRTPPVPGTPLKSAPPSLKSTNHAFDAMPTTGVEDQKISAGVPGKADGSIKGAEACEKSSRVRSSLTVGRRQPEPPRVVFTVVLVQYAFAPAGV